MRSFKYAAGRLFTTLIWIVMAVIGSDCIAQGISIAPLRVIFDGNTRTHVVCLTNRNTKSQTYRIKLINRHMLESGEIVGADTPLEGEYFADQLLRYSPRRVTIPPMSSQTVRLLLRRPASIPEGGVEYRSHMSISAIPETPRLSDLTKESDEQDTSIRAVATVETNIPVVARFGNPQVEISFRNARFDQHGTPKGNPQVSIDLVRTGNRSVYGILSVTHTANDGTETLLSYVRGYAVYSPTAYRHFDIALKDYERVDFSSGQLMVNFIEMKQMHGDREASHCIYLNQETAMTQ